MKAIILSIAAIAAIVLGSFFVVMGIENTAISYEESIENISGNIRVEEKRRFDLIPNLVETVKEYDKHEYETLTSVINSRNGSLGSSNIDEIKLMISAVAEAYPQLKSQENYKELMNELSITENKIAANRKIYNREVTNYKRYVRQFPNKQVLAFKGYEVKNYERLEFENSSVDAPKDLFK